MVCVVQDVVSRIGTLFDFAWRIGETLRGHVSHRKIAMPFAVFGSPDRSFVPAGAGRNAVPGQSSNMSPPMHSDEATTWRRFAARGRQSEGGRPE